MKRPPFIPTAHSNNSIFIDDFRLAITLVLLLGLRCSRHSTGNREEAALFRLAHLLRSIILSGRKSWSKCILMLSPWRLLCRSLDHSEFLSCCRVVDVLPREGASISIIPSHESSTEVTPFHGCGLLLAFNFLHGSAADGRQAMPFSLPDQMNSIIAVKIRSPLANHHLLS